MTNSDLSKRTLRFQSFDEMFAEIDRLHEAGYTANGNWNLAQICVHVGLWMSYPIDGFPNPPFFIKILLWLMKVTVGPSMKRKIFSEGFSAGMQTAPESVPRPDEVEDSTAIIQLRQTVERVRSFQGDLLPSPLFGPMDLETLEQVTLLHAAHHLGFLRPVEK